MPNCLIRPKQSSQCQSRLLHVAYSAFGCVDSACGCPTSRWSGLYLPPVFKNGAAINLSRPKRSFRFRSMLPCGCSAGTGAPAVIFCSCPTICARIVSPTKFMKISEVAKTTPDDHFAAGPSCSVRNSASYGALAVLVAAQLSVPGLYLASGRLYVVTTIEPPQTIISLPVQTAVCEVRAVGALAVLVVVQLFVPGLYLPPVLCIGDLIGSSPDDHFGFQSRLPCEREGPAGALVILVAVQLFVPGLYLPPVLNHGPLSTLVLPKRSFHFRSRLLDAGIGSPRNVGRASRCPTISAWIVSPSTVQTAHIISSTPYNDFASGPHCCGAVSGSGRVGGAGG